MIRLTKFNMHLQNQATTGAKSHMASLNSSVADFFLARKQYKTSFFQSMSRLFKLRNSIPTLKRDFPFHGDDRPITIYTQKAANGLKDVTASNYVFNKARLVTSDNLKGTREIIRNTALLFRKLFGKNYNKFLKVGFDQKDEPIDPKLLQLYTDYLKLKKYYKLRHSKLRFLMKGFQADDIFDKEFKGRKILELALIVNTQVPQAIDRHKLRSQSKDARRLAFSYQFQDCNGAQGGNLGACGSRIKSKDSWPSSLKSLADIFFQRTADIKKKVPKRSYQSDQAKIILKRLKTLQKEIFLRAKPVAVKARMKPNVIFLNGYGRRGYYELSEQDIRMLDIIHEAYAQAQQQESSAPLYSALGKLAKSQGDKITTPHIIVSPAA